MLPGILAVPSSDWITIRPKLGAEAERALGVGGGCLGRGLPGLVVVRGQQDGSLRGSSPASSPDLGRRTGEYHNTPPRLTTPSNEHFPPSSTNS